MKSLKAAMLCALTSAAPLFSASPVVAQQPAQAQATPPGQTRPDQARPDQSKPDQPRPDPFKLNMLIRGSVIALNQANQTGNYSVLRDLAAPAFREANNAARLAEIFAPLRARALDFSPVFFMNPVLIREPEFDRTGVIHVVGYFPSRPQQVIFDMSFQPINGGWKIINLAVDTRPTPPENGGASASAAPEQKPAESGRQQAAQQKPGKPAPNKGQ